MTDKAQEDIYESTNSIEHLLSELIVAQKQSNVFLAGILDELQSLPQGDPEEEEPNAADMEAQARDEEQAQMNADADAQAEYEAGQCEE